MVSRDTSPAAVHHEALRHVGPQGRLKIAFELSDLTHALATAGIQRRNPGYTREQACQELARVLYGSKA